LNWNTHIHTKSMNDAIPAAGMDSMTALLLPMQLVATILTVCVTL